MTGHRIGTREEWIRASAELPGQTAVGLSNYTSFLRPVREGSLHAVARTQHRGRTTWVWEVQILDDRDRLSALTRMTVAVRPTDRGRRS